MKPLRQLRIAHLLAAMVFCALLMYGIKSPWQYVLSCCGMCFLVAAVSGCHARNVQTITICFGMIWVSIPSILYVFMVVLTGHREQGELYCEDGPYAFFFMFAVATMILSFVGAFVGCVIGYLVQRCIQFFSVPRSLR